MPCPVERGAVSSFQHEPSVGGGAAPASGYCDSFMTLINTHKSPDEVAEFRETMSEATQQALRASDHFFTQFFVELWKYHVLRKHR